MAKFLVEASYLSKGINGLLKEGGSRRREAIDELFGSLGGRVEAFYFAYGEHDAYVICDLPDAGTGVAISLAVNASGAVRTSTVPLFTPEEIDAACKKVPSYRAPGS